MDIFKKNKLFNLVDLTSNIDNEGTYFYQKEMQWFHFDRIFVTVNTLKQIYNYKSKVIKPIFAQSEIVRKKKTIVGIPKKFDIVTGLGASDHFPLMLQFNLRSNTVKINKMN